MLRRPLARHPGHPSSGRSTKSVGERGAQHIRAKQNWRRTCAAANRGGTATRAISTSTIGRSMQRRGEDRAHGKRWESGLTAFGDVYLPTCRLGYFKTVHQSGRPHPPPGAPRDGQSSPRTFSATTWPAWHELPAGSIRRPLPNDAQSPNPDPAQVAHAHPIGLRHVTAVRMMLAAGIAFKGTAARAQARACHRPRTPLPRPTRRTRRS